MSKKDTKQTNEIVRTEKRKIFKIIENRRNELNDRMEAYMEEHNKKHVTDEEVAMLMTQNNAYITVNYSARDMEHLFEWYKVVVPKLTNITIQNFPSRLQFCQMIGITSADYESMLNSDNPDMTKTMWKIEDYIQDLLYRAGSKGVINKDMAKHQLEAVHGRTPIKRSEVKTIDERIDIQAKRSKLDSFLTDTDNIIDAEIKEKD